MAGTFTNAGSKEILDYIGNNVAIDGTPGTLYMALWTADPGDTGASGAEISGTSYAREVISWGTPTTANPASMANDAPVEFNGGAAVGGDWNSGSAIPGFAIFTHVSSGVMIASGTLTDQTKVVTNGDTVTFATAAVTITLT